ncbi:MAG: flagellin FliC [Nitrospirae bacterium]|nr:flagellin FliC [Magnetococcales bacterium]HAT48798.1 flagellin FliC [Alphaproteobacteria bacterium]
MALTINNSIASINARRQLEKHTLQLGKTFARLSSGMRINTSQDDAAGMAITNRMVAQIRGMNVAIRNANDGISLAQVAEGALDETQNALQRMRELAIQAANSTYSSSDRANLQAEFEQMLSEVQRVSSDTTFNNNILLGGSANGRYGTSFQGTFHVGADAGQTITIKFSVMNVSALGLVKLHGTNTAASAVARSAQISIGVAATANTALGYIDSALDAVSTFRSSLGALQSRFQSVIASLSNVVENTDAARSRIQDADIATETANLTKYTILQQAGVAILAQANQQPTIALALLGR